MGKLKVVTVLGTRPEIIRLSECIKACDRHFEHRLVHTGQNWDYDLNEALFKDLDLRSPDFFLDSAGEDLGITIDNIISRSFGLLKKEKPDALLVLGDTNSSLASISAKKLKIPIFHMEAGNRCFDQNVPEETNRRIVDHIADVNLPYTEHSRRNLLSEGIRKEHVFVTGSPMREVIEKNRDKIDKSDIVSRLQLKKNEYFLVSAHREENIDDEGSFQDLMEMINAVAETYKLPIVYSIHPRSRSLIEKRGFKFNPLVLQLKPFNFSDYKRLQLDAYCVLSDSGTLSEEASILGFPAVLIRTSTERPEVLDKGSIIIGGIKTGGVLQAIDLAKSISDDAGIPAPVPDYFDNNVSLKVVRIIQSYTRIIDKVIWDK